MIGRADIEGSKSNVAMNAWLPQASYPCGNFSDTSCKISFWTKGSIGHAFTICIHTENQNKFSFSPFGLQEISVLFELNLGHPRYLFVDVPPQPNSPPNRFYKSSFQASPIKGGYRFMQEKTEAFYIYCISKSTLKAVVFQFRFLRPPTYATSSKSIHQLD